MAIVYNNKNTKINTNKTIKPIKMKVIIIG